MSAAKTETPARESPSARTCSVTVLPVPVAPVTSPWRLASASVRISGLVPLPTKIVPSLSRSVIASLPAVIGALLSPSGLSGQLRSASQCERMQLLRTASPICTTRPEHRASGRRRLMHECNNVATYNRAVACFLKFGLRNIRPTCRECGADEGHMDDLIGRVAAEAGGDDASAARFAAMRTVAVTVVIGMSHARGRRAACGNHVRGRAAAMGMNGAPQQQGFELPLATRVAPRPRVGGAPVRRCDL